jgi:hypothetical protein
MGVGGLLLKVAGMVLVDSTNPATEADPTHDAAQTKLATLSTDSSHRVVEGANHAGLIMDEQDAKTTTRAVLDLVASVRSAAPLAR